MSMMPRTRSFVRTLLALLLVSACFAAMVVPLLEPARAAPQAAAVPLSAPDDVIISSFRFIGSGGENDEYIELYNTTGNTIDLTGATLRPSNGNNLAAPIYTFGNITLASGKYYLLGGPGYNDSTGADACYTSGIDSTFGGAALFANHTLTQPTDAIDQVGFDLDGYHEPVGGSTLLAPLTGNVDQSYVRNPGTGGKTYQDTNDNSADFNHTAQNPSAPHNSGGAAGKCAAPPPTPTTNNTVTISGNVQASGVTLSWTDGQIKSVQSDANGHYSLTVSNGWSGTVTPRRGDFTFVPELKTYRNVTSSKTNQNYTAILGAPGPLSLLINEVGWMGTHANANDQWLEIYNPNNYAVDVSSLVLYGYGVGTNDERALSGLLTDNLLLGHGFLLLENSSRVFQNLPPSSYKCKNTTYSFTAKIVSLALSTTYEYPYLSLGTSSSHYLVDFVLQTKWPAGIGGSSVSAASRASMERHNQDYPTITGAWLTFASPNAPCPHWVQDEKGDNVLGSPGEPNWAQSGVNATPVPTSTAYHYKTPTPLPPTPFGHMVINEFLPRAGFDWNHDGAVNVFDEFVELKNLGPIAAQIGGWRIDVISPGGNSSFSLPSVTLQPNQRVVYYSLQTKLSLYDSGGTVRLINNRGVIVDARSYEAVASPDQTTCRIPDGLYWRFPCFPTPGLENSLTGTLPVPPPVIASLPPPCLLADTVPDPFKQAECNGFGSDVFNPNYWDSQSGFNNYPVPDMIDKHDSVVK